MKRQCPGCKKTLDFAVAKCRNCQTTFFENTKATEGSRGCCIPDRRATVAIVTISTFVTMVCIPEFNSASHNPVASARRQRTLAALPGSFEKLIWQLIASEASTKSPIAFRMGASL